MDSIIKLIARLQVTYQTISGGLSRNSHQSLQTRVRQQTLTILRIWLCSIQIVVSKKGKYLYIFQDTKQHIIYQYLINLNEIFFRMQFDSCFHRLHTLGHRMSLSLFSVCFKLHHRNLYKKKPIILELSLSKSVRNYFCK